MLSHSYQTLPTPSSPSSTTGLPPSSPARHTPNSLPPASPGSLPPPPTLRLPRMAFHDNITAAVPRKVYANAHAYHINSISINSDGETYMSADDLRINLWNLGISEQSFSASHHFRTQVWDECADWGQRGHRHSRYQARKHGGTDRGHHGRRVPSGILQPVLLLKLQRDCQAGRHAEFGTLRHACKTYALLLTSEAHGRLMGS